MEKRSYVNWGRNIKDNFQIFHPKDEEELKNLIRIKNNFIFSGNGRSFGDQAINKNCIISSKNFNKIISFDKKNGIIETESGVLLKDLIKYVLPHGWFAPICPGTKYVTIGGMVANNVHGKNILSNQIRFFIKEIYMMNGNNKIIKCSKNKNQNIFFTAIGGHGLTGMILRVKLKLIKIKSDKLVQNIEEFTSYNEFIKLFYKNSDFQYNVFWIGNLSPENFKGLCYLSKHSKEKGELKVNFNDKKINFLFLSLLRLFINNKYLLQILNFIFRKFKKIFYKKIVYFNDFLFSQDQFTDYNRIYLKGMFQFHFLVKEKRLRELLSEMYAFFLKTKIYSSFIVIKKINERENLNQFYGKGVSISMDFPINDKYKILRKFLIEISHKYNLKINLSKDLVCTKSLNTKLHDKTLNYIYNKMDTKNKIRSLMSKRMGLK